ncbi:hypothetical protein ACLOJK_004354 [Asimina triloba]
MHLIQRRLSPPGSSAPSVRDAAHDSLTECRCPRKTATDTRISSSRLVILNQWPSIMPNDGHLRNHRSQLPTHTLPSDERSAAAARHRLVRPPLLGASCSPFRPCYRCRQHIGNVGNSVSRPQQTTATVDIIGIEDAIVATVHRLLQ